MALLTQVHLTKLIFKYRRQNMLPGNTNYMLQSPVQY